MAPSDRGLLDVERFDIEPSHPTMHGLLGDVDSARLANLTNEERLPHALRMTDATRVAPRMAASLIEVSKTLSTWPQLSSEVADIGRREAGASDPVAIAGVLAWGGVGRRHQLFAHTSDYDYLVQNG